MISDTTVTGFYKQCCLLAGFSIWSRFSSYFSTIFCMSWSAPITLERRWTLAITDTIKLGFFGAKQDYQCSQTGTLLGICPSCFLLRIWHSLKSSTGDPASNPSEQPLKFHCRDGRPHFCAVHQQLPCLSEVVLLQRLSEKQTYLL